jgi:hypothetical protein
MTRQLPDGLRVQYGHVRETKEGRLIERRNGLTILPRGGRTYASLVRPDGKQVAAGWSICHPDDNYSKVLGREIALGRAIKALSEACVQPLIKHGDTTRTGYWTEPPRQDAP